MKVWFEQEPVEMDKIVEVGMKVAVKVGSAYTVRTDRVVEMVDRVAVWVDKVEMADRAVMADRAEKTDKQWMDK